jgi:hypothetical protein
MRGFYAGWMRDMLVCANSLSHALAHKSYASDFKQ